VNKTAGSVKEPARRATPTLIAAAHSDGLRNAGGCPKGRVHCFGLKGERKIRQGKNEAHHAKGACIGQVWFLDTFLFIVLPT
jgi:hypothetical protein